MKLSNLFRKKEKTYTVYLTNGKRLKITSFQYQQFTDALDRQNTLVKIHTFVSDKTQFTFNLDHVTHIK